MTASSALTYEFRVEGHLDDHWSAWLGELTITRHHDGTSTLTGPVADQAQLHGSRAHPDEELSSTFRTERMRLTDPAPAGRRRVVWI